MSKLLNVSSSPHVRCGVSTKNLMYDVAIAMLPATIWGVMQFGIYSLIVVVATVLSCVLSEYLFETLMHKPVTISDGSALVTGMILGLNMPPAIPLWMPILGGVFAIIVVKQLYGGLGQNWMNPALAARCFMLISFAQAMTKFTDPVTDAVASATPLAAILFIALFLVGGSLGAIKLKKKYNADLKLTLLTVLLCTAGMLLAVAGCFGGTVIAKPTGDPHDAVTVFFDSLIAGDYTAAYDRVRDYTSLGLENEPSTESGKMVYAALHASYGYELTGSVRTDKLDAAQDVSFTYLSLPALEAAVAEETQVQLKHLVQQLPSSEVYDDNNNYLPEITERAYLQALEKILENAADYYTTEEISLALNYTDGRWQLIMNTSLLKALNGGAGY